eukprot:4534376-Prymnesium_polylepis.1
MGCACERLWFECQRRLALRSSIGTAVRVPAEGTALIIRHVGDRVEHDVLRVGEVVRSEVLPADCGREIDADQHKSEQDRLERGCERVVRGVPIGQQEHDQAQVAHRQRRARDQDLDAAPVRHVDGCLVGGDPEGHDDADAHLVQELEQSEVVAAQLVVLEQLRAKLLVREQLARLGHLDRGQLILVDHFVVRLRDHQGAPHQVDPQTELLVRGPSSPLRLGEPNGPCARPVATRTVRWAYTPPREPYAALSAAFGSSAPQDAVLPARVRACVADSRARIADPRAHVVSGLLARRERILHPLLEGREARDRGGGPSIAAATLFQDGAPRRSILRHWPSASRLRHDLAELRGLLVATGFLRFTGCRLLWRCRLLPLVVNFCLARLRFVR